MSETVEGIAGLDNEEMLEWRLPGLARSTAKTFTLIALVPLTAAIGLVYTRQPLFALLGPAFLAPVLSRYFLIPSYRLTPESARAHWGTGQTEILWKNVRSAVEADGAIRLAPVKKGDPRERFRGVELLLPRDEEIRKAIRTYIRNALPPDIEFEA